MLHKAAATAHRQSAPFLHLPLALSSSPAIPRAGEASTRPTRLPGAGSGNREALQADFDEKRFARPYYWSGFVYTGR